MVRNTDGLALDVRTDDVIDRYLYLFGTWEPQVEALLRERLHAGDTFVDVGANIGYFTLLASRLVGQSGAVVAIEPFPEARARLLGNLARNGIANVRVVPMAVADEPITVTMYRGPAGNLGHTSTTPDAGSGPPEDVRADRLDVLVGPTLANARLIKIDVEGDELKALRSLGEQVDRLRPDLEILVEVTPGDDPLWQNELASALEPMLLAGFDLWSVPNAYGVEFYASPTPSPQLQRVQLPLTTRHDLLLTRR